MIILKVIRFLQGFTQLQIISQIDDLTTIRLNCQQCEVQSVFIDDYMCHFTYSDPLQTILPPEKKASAGGVEPRKLETFSNAHTEVIRTTDSDLENGELVVTIPELDDIRGSLRERLPIKVSVSWLVRNPSAGLYFIMTDLAANGNGGDEGEQLVNGVHPEQLVHLYTAKRNNSSRLWFPCVDSFSESCTWNIMVTVDEHLTAIVSGELVKTKEDAEAKTKTFIYSLQIPTSASNIGLVVGPFESQIHPAMHEVKHFSLSPLKHLVSDSVEQTHKVFDYYEVLLNARYPYTTYKTVFVEGLDCKYVSYATMSIFSVNLLHSKQIIDQTYVTRQVLASAISEQFFGCFISMQSASDAWLTRGISEFLSHDYYKKAFGNNQYRCQVAQAMEKVIKYEQKFVPIILDPSKAKSAGAQQYFHVKNFHTLSPLYNEMHRTKSWIIMRMLENYLGRELLVQVLIKMVSLAQIAAPQKFSSNNWYHLHVSTSSFVWAISTVTGKNIDSFLKQWVLQGGHVKISSSFVFNRKRNTVELEIRQNHLNQNGVRRYLGPLMVWLQELDGTFKHTLQIEDNVSKHDLTCHSKSRRNKKKKIPLCTGEEIDMDLSQTDTDSPVLWMRIDPEMTLLREVVLEQPDYQWQYQLRYERDVIAQLDSLKLLDRFTTVSNTAIKNVLLEIIGNDQVFYRVRCEATMCLRRAANRNGPAWMPPQAFLSMFRKMFSSSVCPNIVRMNNFKNFQHYFLQKAMFVAICGLR